MIHDIHFTSKKSIKNYVSGSNVLIVATLLALIVANTPLRDIYFSFWDQPVILQVGRFNPFSHGGMPMTLLDFINDALMAIFFFTIGLEIKREFLVGELSTPRKSLLPIVAAIGSMLFPVLIFMVLGRGSDYLQGAAIPMATDIAFLLGALSLLGDRVPLSLKIFLTALAVVDDIGGILVIAIFYTEHLQLWYLAIGFGVLLFTWIGGKLLIQSKLFYFSMGGVVWYCFFHSGIHPTIAGVLVAFCIPARPVLATGTYISSIRDDISRFPSGKQPVGDAYILNKAQLDRLKRIESASDKVISPLQDMEDTLHPVVNYLIIPLFAFANAGIYLGTFSIAAFTHGVGLTVLVSLLVGKFTGIFLFSWLLVKTKLSQLPAHTSWPMLAGAAVLGGIGFTVALFIANLSFGDGTPAMQQHLEEAKLGIVSASILAGVIGCLILHFVSPRKSDKS